MTLNLCTESICLIFASIFFHRSESISFSKKKIVRIVFDLRLTFPCFYRMLFYDSIFE